MNKGIAALLVCAAAACAQDARQIIEESQRRARSGSQRYEGTLEVIDEKRKVSTKRWVYERLGSAGQSKAVLRFVAPPEVKGVALLIHNHPDRASDQWMWTPAVQRERRIAFQDRKTRFFGTDFTFEDLEERDVDRSTYRMLGEEPIAGEPCWKIESTPKPEARSQYTKLYVWIRKADYVAAQIDGYQRDRVVRRIRYSEIQNVQKIWTARRIEVEDLLRSSRTVLRLEKLDYDVPLPADLFTLQALRRER